MDDARYTNILWTDVPLPGATAVATPEIEFVPGDVVTFDIIVESITGTPSAASLAVKFQVSPIEFRGLNINYQPSGEDRKWTDVVAGDGFLGHLLLDGAWPASLADQTYSPATSLRIVSRRLLVPSNARLVRVLLTPSYTGGTAPQFSATVTASVKPN